MPSNYAPEWRLSAGTFWPSGLSGQKLSGKVGSPRHLLNWIHLVSHLVQQCSSNPFIIVTIKTLLTLTPAKFSNFFLIFIFCEGSGSLFGRCFLSISIPGSICFSKGKRKYSRLWYSKLTYLYASAITSGHWAPGIHPPSMMLLS